MMKPSAAVKYNPAVKRAVIAVRLQPQITSYQEGGPNSRASPSGTLTPITIAIRTFKGTGMREMGLPHP